VKSRIGIPRSRIVALATITAVAVALAACGRKQSEEPPFPVQDANVPRILIAPFENMGTPDDAFLAAGLTKEITKRLAAIRGLGFVSRNAVAPFEVAQRSVEEMGRELGVDYVLHGSVLWDQRAQLNQQLYVEAQVVRVADGAVLWSDRVVRPMSDFLSVQSAISHAVVDNIGVAINSAERSALDARPTDNPEAYEAYLRGLEYRGSYELRELQQAEEHFNRAISLDPNFAEAHAALSENHSVMFQFRYDRAPQRLASANAAAQRAYDIDPNLPDAHRARGNYYYWCQRNFELALSEFSFAARGRPNDPRIIESVGYVLRRQGRWSEAIQALQRASSMEPENHDIIIALASTLSRVRRYDEAVETCRRAIDSVPDKILPYAHLARSLILRGGAVEEAREVLDAMPTKDPAQQAKYLYEQAIYERDFDGAMILFSTFEGDFDDPIAEIEFTRSLAECECPILAKTGDATSPACIDALESLERKRDDSPGDPAIHAALGWAYALAGRKDEAIEAGRRAVELTPITADAMSGHTYVVTLAKIYAWVDEPYSAVKTIHAALTTPGWISVASLNLDPDWDPIRDDPRFQELLKMHRAVE
jgi:serine/threonine-protein kinase